MPLRCLTPSLLAYSISNQYLDIVPLNNTNGWSLDPGNSVRLPGAHGEDIVRSLCLTVSVSIPVFELSLPYILQEGTFFTAAEDGLIKAWRSPQNNHSSAESEVTSKTDKKRKKHKRAGDHEAARFKPY